MNDNKVYFMACPWMLSWYAIEILLIKVGSCLQDETSTQITESSIKLKCFIGYYFLEECSLNTWVIWTIFHGFFNKTSSHSLGGSLGSSLTYMISKYQGLKPRKNIKQPITSECYSPLFFISYSSFPGFAPFVVFQLCIL